VKNGCPEGNPAALPEPPQFTQGWQLPRVPDDVYAMREKPYIVPADAGPDGVAYQFFTVETGLTEDKWVEAAEVQPGNRAVVHHIIVYVVPPQGNRIFLAAYVPGLRFQPLPDGAAKKVPAGSKLVFQMHYTPIGSVQEDISRVGFIYADAAKVTHEVITSEAANPRFAIPPHDANYQVTSTSNTSPHDLTLLSLSPHMHVRGKSFKYEARYPDGKREVLLDVPHYDFNWQTRYALLEPKVLPAGTRMFCTAVFDNSEDNLANPDPTKEVRWGDQSWEEMMIGYFDVLVPRNESRGGGQRPLRTGVNVPQILQQIDKDGDEQVSRDEAEANAVLALAFDRIDTSGDGQLDRAEIETAVQRLRQRTGQ
jgi:hypothetical protein